MNAFILEHIDTVATIIISVIGGIFYLYNNKKPKILWCQQSYQYFPTKLGKNANNEKVEVQIYTKQFIFSNTGNGEAEDLKIIFEKKPEHCQLLPIQKYTKEDGPEGTQIISVEYMAPKSTFYIQTVGVTENPKILSVGHRRGKPEYSSQNSYFDKGMIFNLYAFFAVVIGTIVAIYFSFMSLRYLYLFITHFNDFISLP